MKRKQRKQKKSSTANVPKQVSDNSQETIGATKEVIDTPEKVWNMTPLEKANIHFFFTITLVPKYSNMSNWPEAIDLCYGHLGIKYVKRLKRKYFKRIGKAVNVVPLFRHRTTNPNKALETLSLQYEPIQTASELLKLIAAGYFPFLYIQDEAKPSKAEDTEEGQLDTGYEDHYLNLALFNQITDPKVRKVVDSLLKQGKFLHLLMYNSGDGQTAFRLFLAVVAEDPVGRWRMIVLPTDTFGTSVEHRDYNIKDINSIADSIVIQNKGIVNFFAEMHKKRTITPRDRRLIKTALRKVLNLSKGDRLYLKIHNSNKKISYWDLMWILLDALEKGVKCYKPKNKNPRVEVNLKDRSPKIIPKSKYQKAMNALMNIFGKLLKKN